MKIIKSIILLVIALGLLWFSEQFSPASLFKPQSLGWIWWVSYAKDLLQPFAFYFFICFLEEVRRTILNGKFPGESTSRLIALFQKFRCDALCRAIIAFAMPTLIELTQIFIRYLVYRDQLLYMGSFDPLDIVIYAVGVGLAVLVEQKGFARLGFWKTAQEKY